MRLFSFHKEIRVAKPTFNPPSGTIVTPGTQITLLCGTPQALLYWEIVTDWEFHPYSLYSDPYTVPGGNATYVFISAYGTKAGLLNSDSATANYTVSNG